MTENLGRYSKRRPTVISRVPSSLDRKIGKIQEKMKRNGNPYVSKVDLLDALATNLERNMARWEKDLGELLAVPGAEFGSRSKKKRPFF